ncbi:MAG TPA: bifunctional precorrin-2 dehydrogenase/sirohydrochlorin ferrochelatase [Nitrososphaeraceae archaeon]|nr:bifunctional precorrin-2 dehydrogenase/sirohydrochlorin ferrochelatase [Nitrososphaeraceae archaeon]
MIVDLNLTGKHVIVIGGGVEGSRKVRGLLGQNCKITVVSERLNSYLEELSNNKKIEIIKMKIKDSSILDRYDDIFLVLAATDDKELNRKIVEKGRFKKAFVYAADDPPVSDFSYASIINIEEVMQVAISTYGKSPIMARKLRIKAERILRRTIKHSDIENTKLQEFARNAARPRIKTVTERKRYLYSLINNKNIQTLINENKIEEAKVAAIEVLNQWGNPTK